MKLVLLVKCHVFYLLYNVFGMIDGPLAPTSAFFPTFKKNAFNICILPRAVDLSRNLIFIVR